MRARRNQLARMKIASLSNNDGVLVDQNRRVFVLFLLVLFFRILVLLRFVEVRGTPIVNPDGMDTPEQSTGE